MGAGGLGTAVSVPAAVAGAGEGSVAAWVLVLLAVGSAVAVGQVAVSVGRTAVCGTWGGAGRVAMAAWCGKEVAVAVGSAAVDGRGAAVVVGTIAVSVGVETAAGCGWVAGGAVAVRVGEPVTPDEPGLAGAASEGAAGASGWPWVASVAVAASVWVGGAGIEREVPGSVGWGEAAGSVLAVLVPEWVPATDGSVAAESYPAYAHGTDAGAVRAVGLVAGAVGVSVSLEGAVAALEAVISVAVVLEWSRSKGCRTVGSLVVGGLGCPKDSTQIWSPVEPLRSTTGSAHTPAVPGRPCWLVPGGSRPPGSLRRAL